MKKLSILMIVVLSAASAGLLVFSACKSKTIEYPTETRETLGTKVTITLYAEGQLVDNIQRIFDQAFATMAHWEQMTLSGGDLNQVTKISEGAGTQSMTVDPEVFEMIMAATRLHDSSGQLFDIRIGPLFDAWDFDSTPTVPDSATLAGAVELVKNGGMFVAGKSILLAKEGMRFDVRHLVEGYIFDLIAKQLLEQGFLNFSIASPSVFLAVGNSPDQRGFDFALHHPLIADSIWANVYVQSGGYAYLSPIIGRFEQDGKFYHSLLNPMTGLPAENLAGTIVHAENAATAEAMAYAVFVRNPDQEIPEEGRELIKGSIKITSANGQFATETSGTLATGFELVH
ncbi:FAD:protein FMN transferase [bacterium]|nr:FAD:protein FMN transferase [bacterium]